ncbi:MAG: SDR family oxidoreductase [Actinomycetota bacterium]|nr:SDR family oxidoreductase [Actinomycetota bacterium]
MSQCHHTESRRHRRVFWHRARAARAFAARGDAVVLVARSAEGLDEVARECRAAGARPLVVPTDVSDEQAVERVVAQAVEEFGRIDAWVNCAAVWSYGRFEDTPSAVFRRIVETTLLGQIHAARSVLPRFRAQGAAFWSTSPPSTVGCPRRTWRPT